MSRHTFLEPAKIMLKPPPGSGRVFIHRRAQKQRKRALVLNYVRVESSRCGVVDLKRYPKQTPSMCSFFAEQRRAHYD